MKRSPPDRRRSLDPRTIRVILSRLHIGFGLACLIFPNAFKLPVYSAFAPSPESWGILCISLGLALLLTRGNRIQIALNIISAFVFLVIAGAISVRMPNTGTLIYTALAYSAAEATYLAARDLFVRRRESKAVQNGG